MSEPKRWFADYSLDADDQVVTHMAEDPQGGFVKWEDYARLKAELEILKAYGTRQPFPSHLYQSMAVENARLKDEVERLREGWRPCC